VAVTGLANLAVKVRDLDAAIAFYERAGAEVRDRMTWNGAERADVFRELDGHTVLWGPEVVSGTFGSRRIAFVEAPGGIRLEFMEQLEEPPP
jgi:hypothetical protein